MSWTLRELCAGSAALTLHLLGARRSLLPYQGSKWKHRRALAGIVHDLGFEGPPQHVVLTDPGPWGVALRILGEPYERAQVIRHLWLLAARDPREVFDTLNGQRCPRDPGLYAAEFLFLQRLAFSGKAVGSREGVWSSPGFNKTSAYGVAGTDRFGEVRPMIPSMIGVLRALDKHLVSLDPQPEIEAVSFPAYRPFEPIERPTLVYLDPPYQGSTPYPDGSMSRDEVRHLAQCWWEAGASVMVSEAEPLELDGWEHQQIAGPRTDGSPFRGKQPEWVTFRARG